MKKIILISMILCTTLYAKWDDFENPNGEPFLMTITLEEGGSIGLSLPVSKWATLKVAKGDGYEYIGSDSYIDLSEPTYSVDIHIPIYKLWKK